jgi:hypothetical protein
VIDLSFAWFVLGCDILRATLTATFSLLIICILPFACLWRIYAFARWQVPGSYGVLLFFCAYACALCAGLGSWWAVWRYTASSLRSAGAEDFLPLPAHILVLCNAIVEAVAFFGRTLYEEGPLFVDAYGFSNILSSGGGSCWDATVNE